MARLRIIDTIIEEQKSHNVSRFISRGFRFLKATIINLDSSNLVFSVTGANMNSTSASPSTNSTITTTSSNISTIMELNNQQTTRVTDSVDSAINDNEEGNTGQLFSDSI